MRLISENFGGNIHETVDRLNQLHLAHVVLQITGVSPGDCIVVFKVEDYATYLWFCDKMRRTPMSTKEFFE